MLINWTTCLVGDRVMLVPYEAKHVETYHGWMQDPYIQEMTASEPLTLEQEFEMQESWRNDPDKLTFIVLSKETGEMAGDCNLFFNDSEDKFACEIEIMIANKSLQRKGLAKEATELLIGYSMGALETKRYVAKISDKNEPSIKLFEKLGFEMTAPSNVFEEVTFELSGEHDPSQALGRITEMFKGVEKREVERAVE